jgi:hypothetical protein
MSLWSSLFSRRTPRPAPESSGLSRVDPTRPAGKRQESGNAQPGNRKSERMARRELLYSVVRDSMRRAGVASTSFKFKVLSLDSRGAQFMVMVDLARDHGGNTAELAEIEALIAQSARSLHNIVVTAVYWRRNEHVAVGYPKAAFALNSPEPAALDSGPAALGTLQFGTASTTKPGEQTATGYDAILPDEVEAFRQALAAGKTRPAVALPAGAKKGSAARNAAHEAGDPATAGARNYTLLTGFEDTEYSDHEQRVPALSTTQHGDLN